MRCLGLDLGSRTTGVGLLENRQAGICLLMEKTVRTSAPSLGKRLVCVADAVDQVVNEYKPDVCAIESPFLGCDVVALSVLCQVRGAVWVTLERRDIPCLDLAPGAVKRIVVGHGRATKTQVAKMLQHELNVTTFSSADASDAVAVAFAGILSIRARGGREVLR